MNVAPIVDASLGAAAPNLQRLDRALNDWILAAQGVAEEHRRWDLKVTIKAWLGSLSDTDIERVAAILIERLTDLQSANIGVDRVLKLLTGVTA